VAKPAGQTLPARFAGVDGATTGAKAPRICRVVGRGVSPATAKGLSQSIQIVGVLCSTAARAGTVDGKEGGVGRQPQEVAAMENSLWTISLTKWNWICNPERT